MNQYKDLYIQTSREYIQSLNNSLLKLEKHPQDKEAIDEIFRSAHSLKSQSAAMGYEQTGFLCHTVEDIFYEIKTGRMELTSKLADVLFRSIDDLEASINQIDSSDKEIDLSPHANKLKEITGVKTVGAGRSVRGGGQSEDDEPPKEDVEEEKKPEEKDEAVGKEDKAQKKEEDPKEGKKESKEEVEEKEGEVVEKIENKATAPVIKTVAVKVTQLDEMMNLLEELLIYRLRLKKIADEMENDELKNYSDVTEKLLENLHYQIMKARTVPLTLVFNHFPRAVRDLARIEEKDIEFVMEGADLELDRSIVDRLDEPLIHLLRNAVSHGIEKKGTIKLSAKREKDYAVITVADSGMGIDWKAVAAKSGVQTDDDRELKELLFSGISTSKEVTQVSGRGVGLKAVKKMVDTFGGIIDVESELGKGTSFSLKLPLTLAITKALLIHVGKEKFAVPALSVDRTLVVPFGGVRKSADQEVFVLEEQEVPLIRLLHKFHLKEALINEVNELLQDSPEINMTVVNMGSVEGDSKLNKTQTDQQIKNIGDDLNKDLLTVVVTIGNEKVGLVVDEIINVLEVVIKPVPEILRGNRAFSGAVILGDGKTVLILNPQGLV